MSKCLPWNRLLFIEGVGRVHALGPDRTGAYECAALDAVSMADQMRLGMRASDIVNKDATGRIVWAVRMPERGVDLL